MSNLKKTVELEKNSGNKVVNKPEGWEHNDQYKSSDWSGVR